MHTGGRGNSRFIDGEVPTWENVFDPVLEKIHTCSGKINAQGHCFSLPRELLG